MDNSKDDFIQIFGKFYIHKFKYIKVKPKFSV